MTHETMSPEIAPAPAAALTPDFRVEVQLRPALDLTDDEFFDLCRTNRTLRFERTAEGAIIILPPAGGATGHRNLALGATLYDWSKRDGTGTAFDSSTGFILPNGATRSPDAAWVRRERLAVLSAAEMERFLPLCPDFVVELRSPSDRLVDIQIKMDEYVATGAKLGWLIDPPGMAVHVYRPERPVEIAQSPASMSGDPELPGFVLTMGDIWKVGI